MTINAILSKDEDGKFVVEIVDGKFAGSIFTVSDINNDDEHCEITYDHICTKLVIGGELQTDINGINQPENMREYFSTMKVFMTDLFNNALQSYIDAQSIQSE